MARDLRHRILDSVQSGLNTTVQTIQAACNQPLQFGSSFYPSTLDQMENVKSGWLRKQGGIVQSWRRRYFVLKGDYIYYYTSDEDYRSGRAPLGSIFLPGNHIIEVPYNPSDAEKFQFEIQPGEKTRMSPTHETYLLSAESEDDRKDWLRVIKHILYSTLGGAIFGQSLELTMHNEVQLNRMCKVPHIVSRCIAYLRENGLREEGLFRLPGRSVVIRQLEEMFDRGERPALTADDPADMTLDVHVVASLLKSYLRELPEPLVPFGTYESVMRIVTRELPIIGEQAAAVALGRILSAELSAPNYNTLQCICQFLGEVATYSDANKMNVSNLATVFVQSFLRPDGGEDPALMLGTSASRTTAAQLMITYCDQIFNREYTPDGAVVIVEDLLGLNANSMVDRTSSTRTAAAIHECTDLDGLDFSLALAYQQPTPQPVQMRQSAGSRQPRPSIINRQSTSHVAGGDVKLAARRGGGVLLRNGLVLEHSDDDSSSKVGGNGLQHDGDLPLSSTDGFTGKLPSAAASGEVPTPPTSSPPPMTVKKNVCRIYPAESGISTAKSSLTLPVIPMKPSQLHAVQEIDGGDDRKTDVELRVQVDQLSAQLKSVKRERDEALARIHILECELRCYRDVDESVN